MQHGNKKYNFEDLKASGDSIIVKPANIYSLKNSLRLYAKEHGLDKRSFRYDDEKGGQIKITRL